MPPASGPAPPSAGPGGDYFAANHSATQYSATRYFAANFQITGSPSLSSGAQWTSSALEPAGTR